MLKVRKHPIIGTAQLYKDFQTIHIISAKLLTVIIAKDGQC
jgi:hypothetical protein